MAKASAVYLIQEQGGAIKIGIAKYPPSRLPALQAGNPRKLMLKAFVSFYDPMTAFKMEQRLHARFGDKRLVGEWFQVSLDEAISALYEELSITPPEKVKDQYGL